MGKIYRNGVVYGGTTDVAGNIRYDNTGTGLGSVTVQNAITELKGLADGATTQVTALPVASAANVNKIYQYTGATNANYINGMFYKCVYDTNVNPAVYKWQIIDTSTSSADEVTYDNTNSGLTAANVQAAIDELNTNDVGKKEYVNNELKGEIFNQYSGNTKNVASGDWSHAEGLGTTAEGSESHAEGLHTTASGNQSHAEGSLTIARGYNSHAEGNETTVLGVSYGGHAEGVKTIVSGSQGHAEGYITQVYAQAGHAEGRQTIVGSAVTDPETGNITYTGNNATYAHAEGYGSIAAAQAAHAEGSYTLASSTSTHAEGHQTEATGSYAHAEGYGTYSRGTASHAENNSSAYGNYSHAEGRGSTVYGNWGHVEGYGTKVGSPVTDPETGEISYTGSEATSAHAEGYYTIASGARSHAEGVMTNASGIASHAEGSDTIASGPYAHSEGSHTTASGDYAHAEGESTSATYANAHAEGDHTQAIARATHAEGTYTQANGISSHAGGFYTIANSKASTVIGKYNNPDPADPTSFGKLFAIGNGTADNARSNILEVSDTYLNVNGDIKQNGVSITSTPHTELTQAQYDALQSPDAGTEYFITDTDTSADVIANLEARVLALESSQTVYYVNGTQRVPLQLSNTYNVTKVNNNTIEWYVNEPTSNKNYKITVTASGAGNTRVNPRAVITEVSE